MNEEEAKLSPILTNITQKQVAILDHDNTNGEGWDYYCNGQVIHAIVSKNEISGIIREYLEDFKVEIKVNEFEISCTCSCDSKNVICRHIVALLYSWVFDKSEFINLNKFLNQLENMDKEKLIKAIERFIINDPRNIKFFNTPRDFELNDFDIDNLSFD